MNGRRYWVGVAARDHVRIGVAAGFCMFAHGKHTAAQRLAPGDLFAYYAPMTGMRTGEPVRAFVALGQVLYGLPEQHIMAAEMVGWRRAARYFPCQQADVYPLLDRLSFVRDPAYWGMAFRRSLLEIGPDDFQIIAEAMGVQLNEELT